MNGKNNIRVDHVTGKNNIRVDHVTGENNIRVDHVSSATCTRSAGLTTAQTSERLQFVHNMRYSVKCKIIVFNVCCCCFVVVVIVVVCLFLVFLVFFFMRVMETAAPKLKIKYDCSGPADSGP